MGYGYNTIAGGNYTFTVSPSISNDRPETPSGLLATKAVVTKDGWLGQVWVDKEIVFETQPLAHSTHAIEEANNHVVRAVRRLFMAIEAIDPGDE